MFPRRAVSEFPNDNPELHDGLVWTASEPCAPPSPTLRLRAPTGELPRVLAPAWVLEAEANRASSVPASRTAVANTEPSAAPVTESPTEPAESAPFPESEFPTSYDVAPLESAVVPKTPFDVFVGALVRVALERGAVRAAAVLPHLFEAGHAFHDVLDPNTLATLQLRRVLEPDSMRPTREFAAATEAWRGLLNGTAHDLAGCGSSTLDVWGGMILGALLNAPRDRTDELRRDLRKRGVAAFGLLAA
jgi:hypothetical protein